MLSMLYELQNNSSCCAALLCTQFCSLSSEVYIQPYCCVCVYLFLVCSSSVCYFNLGQEQFSLLFSLWYQSPKGGRCCVNPLVKKINQCCCKRWSL
ncbi:hypothetical protein RchiOBHm_Chr5g0017891 [Rosa chinensis]|uniref:Uncharacterized protein n=1 Tax=Rosa chinensis TaxID=74649 RepID=A0A2P6Q6J9_ROSCH|nr:hypothetical protein RchiOBHm_Chr5g0017891 [Rosa chinensis]